MLEESIKCDWCKKHIEKGEPRDVYRRASGISRQGAGGVSRLDFHPRCLVELLDVRNGSK